MTNLECIIRAMDDKLATNIVAINMENVSPLFDTFVLCTAGNQRLLQAIKDEIIDQCEENGFYPRGVEGLRGSTWVLIDFGDIVVHIFEGEERNNFNLEKLWGDLPRIDIEQYLK